MLDALLERGLRYAFVSNADNLGAVLDPAILAWFAAERLEFAMEVVRGHRGRPQGRPHRAPRRAARPARDRPGSGCILVRDFRRWRFYNTNNLWLDLEALAAPRAARPAADRQPQDRRPERPAARRPCCSSKRRWAPRSAPSTASPRSACRARGSCPSRPRTTCSSCARTSTRSAEDGRLEAVAPPPFVDLDPEHFGRLADFERRFPDGPPFAGRLRALRRARQRVVRRVRGRAFTPVGPGRRRLGAGQR